jgi:hypothetical protein
LSITRLYGQKNANEIFELSKGTWTAPISKFRDIIDLESTKYSWYRATVSITFITDSSYEVKAVHAGIVRSIFKIESTYAIGVNYGDYWIFYYGIEKPDLNRGDSVTMNQVIGKLYKEKYADDYELNLILLKNTKEINVSKWFRKLANETTDCNNPGMPNL